MFGLRKTPACVTTAAQCGSAQQQEASASHPLAACSAAIRRGLTAAEARLQVAGVPLLVHRPGPILCAHAEMTRLCPHAVLAKAPVLEGYPLIGDMRQAVAEVRGKLLPPRCWSAMGARCSAMDNWYEMNTLTAVESCFACLIGTILVVRDVSKNSKPNFCMLI